MPITLKAYRVKSYLPSKKIFFSQTNGTGRDLLGAWPDKTVELQRLV